MIWTAHIRHKSPHLKAGDVIEYYHPMGTGGDPRWRRNTTVTAVTKDDYPLTLSTGDVLPSDWHVKKIITKETMISSSDIAVYRPIEGHFLVVGGSGRYWDFNLESAGKISFAIQEKIKHIKATAEAEGFAPMDMLVSANGGKK